MAPKRAFQEAVWRAAYEITYGGERGYMPLLSVGEIAQAAEVSRATAQKYMMECVELGAMATFPVGKRRVFQIIDKDVQTYQE